MKEEFEKAHDYLFFSEGETIDEALKRFDDFWDSPAILYYMEEDILDRGEIKSGNKLTSTQIETIEKNLGCQIPDELNKLYRERGLFEIDFGSFYPFKILRPNKKMGKIWHSDFLDRWLPKYCERFNIDIDTARKQITENVTYFATFQPNDDCCTFLFFDKNGEFGIFSIDQDDGAVDIYDRLLSDTYNKQTLDSLISIVISDAIEFNITMIEDQI